MIRFACFFSFFSSRSIPMNITISLLLKLFFLFTAVQLMAITNSQCKAFPPNHKLRAIVMISQAPNGQSPPKSVLCLHGSNSETHVGKSRVLIITFSVSEPWFVFKRTSQSATSRLGNLTFDYRFCSSTLSRNWYSLLPIKVSCNVNQKARNVRGQNEFPKKAQQASHSLAKRPIFRTPSACVENHSNIHMAV